ncbi:phage tail tape measure protein [Amphibacillus jilinensis]|uniref:phage tail tape measure protein n=1 Tax=Amphibacillus jilinensis TaxID=1216008 RepID=UPI0003189659|nr:phage tail tape measure protein [Amphibacillus jilinensis]
MANVGSLRTTISLDSAQFEQSMAGVNRQLKSLKQEQKAVTSSGTGFARGTEELRRKQDVLSRTLDLQQGKVQELKRRYEESATATGENSKETQDAMYEYQKAVAEMNKTENALKGVTDELNKQTNPWNQLSDKMGKAGQKMQDVGKKMTSFGKSWSMRVTAPIVGMGALILNTATEFEAAMSNVQAVSGATGSDLELLEAAAREMGATTTKSASDAADGLGYMALAGWETQEMLDGLEPILRLSEAGNIDLARASDLVTDSMSALGIEVKDLPAYLDNVAEASRSSNTSIDQLMQAYLVAGGNLNQFNVPLAESTALLGVMADNGIKGSEAGRGLNAIMINLTSGAGRAGTALEELNISAFDADGQFIGLEETLRLVKDRTQDMTDEQRAQYVSMIAGKEHMKTFQALMSELDDGYVDLKENVSNADGALNDIADTMQDNARGNVEQLKSATQELALQFAEHLIPVFTDVVNFATDLAQKFGELDSDTQRTIITMAGLAAVVGPAAIVMGNLTTAIGGVVKIGGRLAGVLGKVGGGALLGKLGALGLTGPVGLAVAGVGALSLGIYALNRETKESITETDQAIQKRFEEVQALDETIDAYERLQEKNKLTTDEMLRYMDIMDELKEADSDKAIAALVKEQEDLLEASGFTNEEMEEFLSINEAIVERNPEVVEAISEQGNAYVGVSDELRELSNLERQRAIDQSYADITSQMDEHVKNLADQIKYQEKLIELEQKKESETQAYIKASERTRELSAEINELREQQVGLSLEDSLVISEKILELENELMVQEGIVDISDKQIGKIEGKIEKQRENLDGVNEEIDSYNNMLEQYESMLLYQEGIVDEKGNAYKSIQDANEALREQRSELRKQLSDNELTTEEYQNQIDKLKEQEESIKDIQGEAGELNTTLERKIDKEVGISANPSLDSFNTDWTSPLSRTINLQPKSSEIARFGYATGTDYHPGGNFLAGEQGIELGRMGDKWELLDFGLYNRPAGYQVFTHDETKSILSALNNVPGYATGVSPTGEANRVVSQLNNATQSSSQPVVIEVHVTSEMDSRAVGKGVARVVTEIQDTTNRLRGQFAT